ncbi:hypothetical protein AC1031_011376 [Aphanomyces cochlioides]|nr:hypothetical protein AC1031_011376 [Aphanomyces cochlioides]
MKPSMFSLLPFDILVKIVFFICEWNDVLALLEVLRPANVLGPLESLRRLHLLNWGESNLWPKLDLTNLNEASRVDIEKIVKFYSKVIVNIKTNVNWVRQYVHPNTSVEMKDDDGAMIELEEIKDGCWYDLDTETLAKWKDIRVVAIDEKIFNMPSYLVYFPHLVVISCQQCTREMATAIFDYAASSTTLRTLEVDACERLYHSRCKITSSMAEKLHQWIKSQPIEFITIIAFTWELCSQRHTVVSSALAKLSLKELQIFEEFASGWFFSGSYCRAEQALLLEFCDPRNRDFENLDLLVEYIHSFEPVFDSDIKSLELLEFRSAGFNELWSLFVPLLQRVQLEELAVNIVDIKVADAVKVVETIRNVSTLECLSIVNGSDKLPMDVVLTLLHRAPSSVKRLPIVDDMTFIDEPYSHEESTIFRILASKRGIDLLL